MARLILNDVRLNAVWLLGVFVFFNLDLDFLSAFMRLSYHRLTGAEVGFFFASVMVLIVFLREEYNKGQIIYRSLPLSPAKIVTARYLSILLIALACMTYGLLFQQIIIRFSPSPFWHLTDQMDAGYALEHSLIARGFAISVIFGIAMPLMMRFSMFWGILAGYLACLFIWSRLVDRLMSYSLHTTFFLGLSRWSFFAVVLMIAINAIAFRLSVWLYGQRQF